MTFALTAAWVVAFVLALWGTIYTIWRSRLSKIPAIQSYPSISILKPLKGTDPGLRENLRSFLEINYPEYEVLFSVSDEDDPAVPIAKEFLSEHIKLIFSDNDVGINPKVNNLVDPEKMARFDHMLVSDSNIRAHSSYLRELVPLLQGNVGIISASVKGFGGEQVGGKLEEMHLNTYYARWMNVAASFGCPFVLGKSMFYKRSVASQFGGLSSLGNYLAEDYMMGLSMTWIGKDIRLMHRPVAQYVGRKTVKDFWMRNYRWTVLQKHSAPGVFVVEPLSFAFVASVAGACGVGLWWLLPVSLLLFFCLDMLMCWNFESRMCWKTWLLKELLAPLIWLHALACDTVDWRGSKLKVLSKGLAKKVA